MLERLLRRFRAPVGPAWVEVDDLRRRLRRGELALVLDVRESHEFDGPLGHIPGALNVPLASLRARVVDLTRVGCPIVAVCLTDKRSSQAAAQLVEGGVADVAVLRGGMRAWRASEPATLNEGPTSAGAP